MRMVSPFGPSLTRSVLSGQMPSLFSHTNPDGFGARGRARAVERGVEAAPGAAEARLDPGVPAPDAVEIDVSRQDPRGDPCRPEHGRQQDGMLRACPPGVPNDLPRRGE